MSDLYPRPSRDEIAARHAAADTARKAATPPGPPDYMARLARHLAARMRALGIDQAQLQERAGIKSPQVAARAINGTGCDIALAGKIAAALGSDLAAMLQPYTCGTCAGQPHAGFACLECGTERRQS